MAVDGMVRRPRFPFCNDCAIEDSFACPYLIQPTAHSANLILVLKLWYLILKQLWLIQFPFRDI